MSITLIEGELKFPKDVREDNYLLIQGKLLPDAVPGRKQRRKYINVYIILDIVVMRDLQSHLGPAENGMKA